MKNKTEPKDNDFSTVREGQGWGWTSASLGSAHRGQKSGHDQAWDTRSPNKLGGQREGSSCSPAGGRVFVQGPGAISLQDNASGLWHSGDLCGLQREHLAGRQGEKPQGLLSRKALVPHHRLAYVLQHRPTGPGPALAPHPRAVPLWHSGARLLPGVPGLGPSSHLFTSFRATYGA